MKLDELRGKFKPAPKGVPRRENERSVLGAVQAVVREIAQNLDRNRISTPTPYQAQEWDYVPPEMAADHDRKRRETDELLKKFLPCEGRLCALDANGELCLGGEPEFRPTALYPARTMYTEMCSECGMPPEVHSVSGEKSMGHEYLSPNRDLRFCTECAKDYNDIMDERWAEVRASSGV